MWGGGLRSYGGGDLPSSMGGGGIRGGGERASPNRGGRGRGGERPSGGGGRMPGGGRGPLRRSIGEMGILSLDVFKKSSSLLIRIKHNLKINLQQTIHKV